MGDYIYKVDKSVVRGEVTISGAKNSVLRLMAASLLCKGPVVLENYPENLLDVQVHEGMLKALGKAVYPSKDRVVIEDGDITSELIWEGRSIRNTLLILGALVARTGLGKVPLPGGCKLGERKYDLHVMLLERLGATVFEEGEYLIAEAKNGLVGNDIHLPMRSTGATENAIICGALAQGKTTVWNPHIRPEIMDLISFLKSCGANIEVFGQERIEVYGVGELSGCQHTVIPDNMEALTWVVAAAITGGSLEIKNFPFDDLEVPLAYLKESGVRLYRFENNAHVGVGGVYPIEISTGPYPGINSDMQPIFAVFGACSNGISKIVDLRFPGRYGYSDELAKMGVASDIVGDMLVVKGGARISGAEVRALDLRAGIALLLAGLVAEGTTYIHDSWQIDRGYNNLIEKLISCGVRIEKVST